MPVRYWPSQAPLSGTRKEGGGGIGMRRGGVTACTGRCKRVHITTRYKLVYIVSTLHAIQVTYLTLLKLVSIIVLNFFI